MMMIVRGEIEAWGTGSGNEGPVLSEPERLRERPGPGRVAKCQFFLHRAKIQGKFYPTKNA